MLFLRPGLKKSPASGLQAWAGVRLSALLLLAMLAVVFLPAPGEASSVPYEYWFEKDYSGTFNQIQNTNLMKVRFDKAINKDYFNSNRQDIYIDPQPAAGVAIHEVLQLAVSGKEITIMFDNLELLNYTGNLEYELVIPRNTMYFDQLADYRLPFELYELLPGLKSTFIESNAGIINDNVFRWNAPRDISIHVPEIYINQIETIHRYQNLLPDANDRPDPDDDLHKEPGDDSVVEQKAALTNVDILANPEVHRIKLGLLKDGIDKGDEFHRDIFRRPEGFFSAGLAGLLPRQANQLQSPDELVLRSFNNEGKFLETRKFRLEVRNLKDDFVKNDYIAPISGVFGQTYTLYELMGNTALVEDIISMIPVSQLDTLKVTYLNPNQVVPVESYDQLVLALQNPNIKKIEMMWDITIPAGEKLVVRRDVEILGSGKQLIGNVELGIGSNINPTLRNMDIIGNLLVNVGANGTAILDRVQVTGNTEIRSGGTNTVYLNNFTSDVVKFTNVTPVRVRVTGRSDIRDMIVESSGKGIVRLEVDTGAWINEIIMKEDGTLSDLKTRENLVISIHDNKVMGLTGNIEVAEGKTVIIKGTHENTNALLDVRGITRLVGELDIRVELIGNLVDGEPGQPGAPRSPRVSELRRADNTDGYIIEKLLVPFGLPYYLYLHYDAVERAFPEESITANSIILVKIGDKQWQAEKNPANGMFFTAIESSGISESDIKSARLTVLK